MTNYDVKRLALALAIQAEIEGMKAENKQREIQGNSMAYVSHDFDHMARQLWELANKHDEQL
jgi:hypothetical protein